MKSEPISRLGPSPRSRQRSPWVKDIDPLGLGTLWKRNVHDGQLFALVAEEEPLGWHLSISHRRRYPTWDEITDARYELVPDDIDMVMHLPPPDEYVAVHDNCFHLHEHPERVPWHT